MNKAFIDEDLCFHSRDELAGLGGLVLVGLLECWGLGLVLLFELLVAGDDFVQGVGFCSGLP